MRGIIILRVYFSNGNRSRDTIAEKLAVLIDHLLQIIVRAVEIALQSNDRSGGKSLILS